MKVCACESVAAVATTPCTYVKTVRHKKIWPADIRQYSSEHCTARHVMLISLHVCACVCVCECVCVCVCVCVTNQWCP